MLDTLIERYPEYEYPLAQAQLVLFMLGMGATLTWRDFAVVFRKPRALSWGLAWVLAGGPLLAVAVAEVAGLPAGVGFGLLLVAALPGGTLSNFLTYLARGNVALSIALTAVATLVCLFTLPLVLEALAGEFVPPGFEMPVAAVVQEIILCLLIPLWVGMVVAERAPQRSRLVAKAAIRLGAVLVVLMVVGSFASGRIELDRYGWKVPVVIVAFTLLAQQLSMLPIRVAGWPTREVVAVGVEATIRNIYLGLLLAAILFPAGAPGGETGGDVLFVVLFYAGASLGCGLPLALRIRRVIGREEKRTTEAQRSQREETQRGNENS